jgi:hypothetical protein
MAKFEAGQTVWGAKLEFGRLEIGSAVIKSCGPAQARLVGPHGGAAFGYRCTVPISEVYATEWEALEWSVAQAERAERAAEEGLKRARDLTQSIRDTMAKKAAGA